MKRKFTQIQRLSLSILALLVFLLAACAPAIPESVATDVTTPQVINQVSSQVPQVKTTENTVPETDQPTPIMIATSRGPNLEATDPSTAQLASGQLQLVEFFRFT